MSGRVQVVEPHLKCLPAGLPPPCHHLGVRSPYPLHGSKKKPSLQPVPCLCRCIAVPGRVQGVDPHASVLGRDFLRSLAQPLLMQDAQPAFRSRALSLVPE